MVDAASILGLPARGAGLLLGLSPRTETGFLGQVWLSTNYYKYESRNQEDTPCANKIWCRGPGLHHPYHRL